MIRTSEIILVVEDDADLAEAIRFNLERERYLAPVARDGPAALARIQQQRPELVLLDRMLPGLSGDEVLARLKRDAGTASIPVIMLTAKAEESDELVGFALGADDYITKPFSMKLLIARVRAMLRRCSGAESPRDVLTAGPIRLSVARHEVTVDDHAVNFTATEFKLMRTLMAANGRVLSRDQLINAVLGVGVAVTDRTIDVHVTAIRRKLGPAAEWIQTIRGVGYTCREPD